MSLLPVAEAIARVTAGILPLGTETVPIAEAAGRVLATDLAARRTQPPFPASAMDGYALRGADAGLGATFRVVGMAAAGHGFTGTVGPGETVRIFTGAPVPDGADTILIQEDAAREDDTIRVTEAAQAGRHVRHRGLDFAEGAVMLPAGTRLGMRQLSLAAAMGHGTLPVRTRPRVAIIATGDELVPPGAPTGPDQIVASNATGLAALVASLGGIPHDLGIVGDDVGAIAEVVRRAVAVPADIVVTLGGASVGDHDLARAALEAVGMRLDFWQIAMRPGKPLMFGTMPVGAGPGARVLGLPGNPVSTLVGGLLFLRPLVAAYLGTPAPDLSEPAVLGVDVAENDKRQDYVRAVLRAVEAGLPEVVPLTPQDSSMLSTLARADCLLIRPPFAPAASAGTPCRILRLP